jgi:hypothetical protein
MQEVEHGPEYGRECCLGLDLRMTALACVDIGRPQPGASTSPEGDIFPVYFQARYLPLASNPLLRQVWRGMGVGWPGPRSVWIIFPLSRHIVVFQFGVAVEKVRLATE